MGGGEDCGACRSRQGCGRPGHGRFYVGVPHYGFRTDRCLHDWSSTPFVREVQEAYAFMQAPGGAAFLTSPSWLLARAVRFYDSAIGMLLQHEREERERKDELERLTRGG